MFRFMTFLTISAVRHLWAKTLTPDTTMCNAVITVSGLLRSCQILSDANCNSWISLDFWVTATVQDVVPDLDDYRYRWRPPGMFVTL